MVTSELRLKQSDMCYAIENGRNELSTKFMKLKTSVYLTAQ